MPSLANSGYFLAILYDQKYFQMEILSLMMFDGLNKISNGSLDFDNPKVYGDTSILDGLVLIPNGLVQIRKSHSHSFKFTDPI